MSTFHVRLRELRTARGMSLKILATAAYISRSHLSEMENGTKNPSLATARALDVALGTGGELAGLVPIPPPRDRIAARLAQAITGYLLANGLADAIAEKVVERLLVSNHSVRSDEASSGPGTRPPRPIDAGQRHSPQN